MGRNPLALFVRGRINPHERKTGKYKHHKRAHDGDDVSDTETGGDGQEPAKMPHMANPTSKNAPGTNIIASATRKEFDDSDDDDSDHYDGDGFEMAAEGDDEEGAGDRRTFAMTEAEVEAQRSAIGPSALRSVKELFSMPSREELEQLNASTTIYHSELFRFQMEEMLKNVRPHKTPAFVAECLGDVREALMGMKAVKRGKRAFSSDIKIPASLPLDAEDVGDVNFDIQPPEEIHEIGSFVSDTHCRPDLTIDLVVEMPGPMPREDRKRYRFFHKRAFYTAVVLSVVRACNSVHSAEFQPFQGDPLTPIVVVVPKTSSGGASKYKITLHVVAPAAWLKLSHFKPLANALQWKDPTTLHTSASVDFVQRSDKAPATPRYNLRFLMEKFMVEHAKFIKRSSREYGQPFRETVMLLKVWLRQRNMTSQHFGAFNGFAATMLLIHLLMSRKILKESSPYQMFRQVMATIAMSDWDKSPITMRQTITTEQAPPPVDDFNRAFLVSFIDPTGHCNLLGHMTQGQYDELKYEAARALKLLDTDDTDAFSSLFLVKHAYEKKFDFIVHVELTPMVARKYAPQLMDRAGDWVELSHRLIPQLIRQGVGNRARFVTCLRQPTQPFSGCNQPSSFYNMNTFTLSVGIVADHANYARGDDILPAESGKDDAVAQRFCNFWGNKATLRAMSDGSLRYGVVWNVPPTKKHVVVKWIVLHVLARHLEVTSDAVAMQTFLFEPALVPLEGADADLAEKEEDTAVLKQFHVKQAFEDLSRAIRALDLPLYVKEFSCVAPSFRHTDPFPPVPALTPTIKAKASHAHAGSGHSGKGSTKKQKKKKGKRGDADGDAEVAHRVSPTETYSTQPHGDPLEAILQFEASNKWPDDVSAIQEIKSAFLLSIARELRGTDIGMPGATGADETVDSDDDDSEDGDGSGVQRQGHRKKRQGASPLGVKVVDGKLSIDGIIRCRLTRSYLDVSVRGYLFRIVLFVERELLLLQRQAKNLVEASRHGSLSAEDAAKKDQLETISGLMTRDFVKLPQVTSLLHDFAVQYESFSVTARLAKRWLHAHLFSSYIDDELVDLLVLSLYNSDLPYLPPVSADVGFLRFLDLLIRHNWLDDPLFVDPLNNLSAETKATLREQFRCNRHTFPVMTVVTSIDTQSLWSKDKPTKQIFHRLIAYAKASLKAVTQSMGSIRAAIHAENAANGDVGNIFSVFTTPTAGFVMCLHIKPSVNTLRMQSIEAKCLALSKHGGSGSADGKQKQAGPEGKRYKNLETRNLTLKPPVDPVKLLLAELRARYEGTALFFHDDLGGSKIFVSIPPKALLPREFRKTGCTTTCLQKDGRVSFNLHEMATAIVAAGSGIVDKVEML